MLKWTWRYMCMCAQLLSPVWLFATPWTIAPPRLLCPWVSLGRTLEWVAFSFFRGSSWLRDQTRLSYIAGRFFTAEPLGSPRRCLHIFKLFFLFVCFLWINTWKSRNLNIVSWRVYILFSTCCLNPRQDLCKQKPKDRRMVSSLLLPSSLLPLPLPIDAVLSLSELVGWNREILGKFLLTWHC